MADARQLIESRVRAFAIELEVLVRQAAIEAVSQALGGTTPARRGTGRPPKATFDRAPAARPRLSAARGRRSADQMDNTVAALLRYIKQHPGQRMEEIAAALGSTSQRLHRPTSKLLSSNAVKRVGQKRASKYFPR